MSVLLPRTIVYLSFRYGPQQDCSTMPRFFVDTVDRLSCRAYLLDGGVVHPLGDSRPFHGRAAKTFPMNAEREKGTRLQTKVAMMTQSMASSKHALTPSAPEASANALIARQPDPVSALVKYEAACKAIADCKSVDEAKNIRNVAEAMRAYARKANNRKLEVDAIEIRIRAERRLGEMIAAQKATVGLNVGKRGDRGPRAAPRSDDRPTLAEVGIGKKLSSHAQKLAALPPEEFDRRLGQWHERAIEDWHATVDLLRERDKAGKRTKDSEDGSLSEEGSYPEAMSFFGRCVDDEQYGPVFRKSLTAVLGGQTTALQTAMFFAVIAVMRGHDHDGSIAGLISPRYRQ